MKKFLSFLLTFVMLFSLTMPAMAAEITGNTENPTEGEVSATFTPDIKLTGMEYVGEEATYNADTNTYTVVIPAGTTSNVSVGVKLTGTNLDLAEGCTHLQLREFSSAFGDSKRSTEELLSREFKSGFSTKIDGFWVNYQYSNDGGTTWSDEILRIEVKHGYSVTVNESTNGSVSADKTLVAPGETVTLNVSPADNYGLNELTVTDASGNDVTVENNSFTMPASAVTVSATFKYTGPYDITVNASDNGTVTADMQTATAGTTVTLTVTPDDDYRLSAVAVNDGAVEVTKVNDTTYTFVMPDAEVSVNATFEKIPHNVTVNTSENGTVVSDKETATQGETVTLTWTAAEGYTLDEITVIDASGDEVTVDQGVLACTFVMPSSDVTVTATFKEMPVTSVAITWGSMSFTYSDEQVTQEDGSTADKGWSDSGTGWVTVENTGETTFTAKAEYASYEGYESIKGSFDTASKELAPASGEQAGEKYTFTLELSGKPTKVLTGVKIGKVTITINESAEG